MSAATEAGRQAARAADLAMLAALAIRATVYKTEDCARYGYEGDPDGFAEAVAHAAADLMAEASRVAHDAAVMAAEL